MSVTAVIIARMGSTRLPGKVLMLLGGQPVLHWVFTALRGAPGVDNIIVATSTLPADDAIEKWCVRNGVMFFRGSEADVLHRFAGAVRAVLGTTVAVRVTADCPFLDPEVVGAVVRLQKQAGCAYASNVDPRTWPDGLDVEAFTVDALFAAENEASRPIDRECVTTWIQRNRSRFPAKSVVCPLPNQAVERWVLDTHDDYLFCQKIAAQVGMAPSWLKILDALDRKPELRKINAHHPTNERYHEAVANEPLFPRDYTRSQEHFARATTLIPLGAQTFSKSHVQFPQPSPLYVTHGQGGVVWDVDGNEYVDLVSALLPTVLGNRDPDVDAAIRDQLAQGISFSLATELEAALAERLTSVIPCAEMVRFGKSGSDATSAAVRLARAYRKNDWIAIVEGAYHGWHDWAVAHTFRERGTSIQTIVRVPADKLLDNIADWAGVIVDPTNHDRAFLKELRARCDKTGMLLIFDEILSGFRYHMGGAQALYEVTPDLACFGKALGNGMPISAIVGRRDIMRLLAPPNPCVFFSGTFGGEALSIAAAIATFDKLRRLQVPSRLWAIGHELRAGAEILRGKYRLEEIVWFSGEDCFVRIHFRDQNIANVFRRSMISAGTLVIASHNVCFAHGPNEIKRVLRAYDATFALIRKNLNA